jgi:hypothetical protein
MVVKTYPGGMKVLAATMLVVRRRGLASGGSAAVRLLRQHIRHERYRERTARQSRSAIQGSPLAASGMPSISQNEARPAQQHGAASGILGTGGPSAPGHTSSTLGGTGSKDSRKNAQRFLG